MESHRDLRYGIRDAFDAKAKVMKYVGHGALLIGKNGKLDYRPDFDD